ncbi:CBS-HotDog domain-containing transcription factor SpxR [Streptococcus agalactiae]|nr:CBS domain-containing protein [Streptococcus agalactiae]MCK6347186.1 CBS-HotDog domain-containing transcription factor SpxR [Streptococcus agalactiae]
MSKHQEILEYLENLAVGKRVSVRSISNHLKVSDGTAYRAIKEAENRGIVETRPRSGTVRVAQKAKVNIEKLTYAEIARISDSQVVAGIEGLSKEFSKFSIGAMTHRNIEKYLVQGGLLIVGDRDEIQHLALQHQNAILVTGGFNVSPSVCRLADKLQIPVMVTHYDTFTVSTMINHTLSNAKIRTDLKTVEQVYQSQMDYGFLAQDDTVKEFNLLVKQTKNVRFPIVNQANVVVGVVSVQDILGKDKEVKLATVMSKNIIVAKPRMSLANISQKMIFEDLNMMPVVSDDFELLGVITRRQAVENLSMSQGTDLYTYSDQILSNLQIEDGHFSFLVEPAMIDHTGSLTQGVLTEFLKEICIRVLTRKHQRSIVVKQMTLYFLQPVQIDEIIMVTPTIISEKRREATLDLELKLENKIIATAMIAVKIN